MSDDLAGAPRWRGQRGRLEVWYATATDRATGTGVWLHHERVAPTNGEPYVHGWGALFPAGRAPVVARFGPEPCGQPATGSDTWLSSDSGLVGPEGFYAWIKGGMWEVGWEAAERPMWTLPKSVWTKERLPSAHVVVAPKARIQGTVDVGGIGFGLDGIGAVSHIYGHGNAQRWGWLHADLDDETSLEIVSAVARRPGMRGLPPLAFVQLRRDGRDWPRDPLLTAPLFRSRLSSPTWRVRGVVGRTRLTVTVHQPDERCVVLDYTDPNGDGAVCTNSERADVDVTVDRWRGRWITEAEWSVEGTAHSELGTRHPS